MDKLDWQPLNPATIADPFPKYQKMVATQPVFWHDALQSWVVADFAGCRRVLREHDTFARDRRRIGVEIPDDQVNIQTQDPPEQARLRRSVMRALHSQDLRGVSRLIRGDLEQRMEKMRGTGAFDFVSEIAFPVSINLINTVFGTDYFTAESYQPIFEALTRGMDSGLDPARVPALKEQSAVLKAAVRDWLAQPATAAGLVADLQAEPAVMAMPAPYVFNTLAGVYNAGFSTSAAAVSSAVSTLLSSPEALAQLPSTGSGATAAHEFLRFTSPAQATARVAAKPTELGGVQIAAGDTIVTLMAAANRDPAVFTEPNRLLLSRDPNPHLAFAWGPHICLGAQLAVAWIAEFIRYLRDHRCEIVPAGPPEYMDSATLRNITRLPIEYRGP